MEFDEGDAHDYVVADITNSAVFDDDDVESIIIGRKPQRRAPKRKGRR